MFDTGAVPYLISIRSLGQLGIDPSPTRRTVTVAGAVNARCTGLVKDVPVFFAKRVVELDV